MSSMKFSLTAAALTALLLAVAVAGTAMGQTSATSAGTWTTTVVKY